MTNFLPNNLLGYADLLEQAPSLTLIAANIRKCALEWQSETDRANSAENRLNTPVKLPKKKLAYKPVVPVYEITMTYICPATNTPVVVGMGTGDDINVSTDEAYGGILTHISFDIQKCLACGKPHDIIIRDK